MNKYFLLMLALFVSNSNAATITWSSVETNATLNDIFSVDVIGTNFIDNVDGGGVNIGFDSGVLNVLSVSINETVWDFGGSGISTGAIDNAVGTVSNVMVNAASNVNGDFVVASIQFQVIGNGSSALSLTEFALNPWANGGYAINPVFVDETFSTIPVPAAVWLFGSGLIGLIGIAKRKKA